MPWLVIDGFLHIVFSLVLYLVLFRHHFRFSPRCVYIWATICVLITMIVPAVIIQFNPDPNEWVLGFSVIYIISLILLCTIFTKFSVYRILLTFFILMNYMNCISLFKECAGNLLIQYLPSYDYYVLTVILRTIGGCVSFPFMLWFCLKLLRPLIDRPITQPYFKYLWIIPACFYIMYRLYINPKATQNYFVYQDISVSLFFVWVVGSFTINCCILKMLLEMMNKAEVELKLEVSNLNHNIQKKQYERLMNQMNETKTIRHDLRHHVVALKGLCDAKAYDQLAQYLNSMSESLALDTSLMFCENILLNALLKHYYQVAQENQITCDIQVEVTKDLNINDEDLCVAVGNAMENAIEATKRLHKSDAVIQVRAQVFGEGAFTFQVSNPFQGEIRQNKDGVYLSSKRKEEGIGISSIQQICEKYNGVCNITQEHHVFTISLLLNKLMN